MSTTANNNAPPVCDYEGSDYRARFWEGGGRNYEDLAERIALRRLMPPTGSALIEIGAGFGRLADEYLGYDRVVLFDFSRSLLREAQEYLRSRDPAGRKFIYVAGNWYQMPFVPALFDTMVQVRTLHHAADAPALFRQLSRIALPHGRYVLEFANKRNFKAMLRYGLRRQSWSPYEQQPVEFVPLNFDFHPKWIKRQLLDQGFTPDQTLTVSHFRLGLLKRLIPHHALATVDGMIQPTGRWWQFTPSVFIRSVHPQNNQTGPSEGFFACPTCSTSLGDPLPVGHDQTLSCSGCGHQWRFADNLYDFKEPV